MNKFLSFFIAFFALCRFSYAQDAQVFAKGDKVVSASLGFINTIHTGTGWKGVALPISLAGEYGIVDGLIDGNASIGVGVDFGYARFKYSFQSSGKQYVNRYSDVILGVRGGFHYQFVDKLDTYAGLLFGYNIVSGESIYASSEPIWGGYVGARYYFSDNFAALAELGNSVALINLGVAYKF
jgi:hypothetical protein